MPAGEHHGDDGDYHVHCHWRGHRSRDHAEQHARRADGFYGDQIHGRYGCERDPDAVQERGDARNAHVELLQAVPQEDPADGETEHESGVRRELGHVASSDQVGFGDGATGLRRRASVRTWRAPRRLMMTSNPRCGCAAATPATSAKHNPAAGTACRATCPPWHTTTAVIPCGPLSTVGGPAGFMPAALAVASSRPESACASASRPVGMPPKSAKTCSKVTTCRASCP